MNPNDKEYQLSQIKKIFGLFKSMDLNNDALAWEMLWAKNEDGRREYDDALVSDYANSIDGAINIALGIDVNELDLVAVNGELYLNDMFFPEIPKWLNQLRPLNWLFLTDNCIQKISVGDLPFIEELTYFCVRKNIISKIEADSFTSIPNVEKIDLSSNDLEYLPIGCFNGCKKLKSIDLHNNQLKFIHPDVFNDLPNLCEVKIGQQKQIRVKFVSPKDSTKIMHIWKSQKLSMNNMNHLINSHPQIEFKFI